MPRSALRKAADRIHHVAAAEALAHLPKPERFRVTVVSPLELEGIETDTLLDERDDDVEVFTPVRDAFLSVGDIIWVQPEAGPDGREIQRWNAVSVVDAALHGGVGPPVSVPDASATVKGIVRLSIPPASPTNPVAVGDNDPRLGDSRPPSGAAGGDLTGAYPNPSIAAGAVTNAKVSAAAGIARSKLDFGSGLTNADLAAGAGIAYSKLNLTGSITHGDVAAANKDGAAGTPSLRTLGSGAAQAAAGNDARFLIAPSLAAAGKGARDTYGTFDQAAVFSLIGNRTPATTQVMGTTDPGGTDERGSVSLYLDNSTRNRGGTGAAPRSWLASSSATVFTASSVRFTDGTDLSLVTQGMFVDVGGAPGTGGHLAAGFVSSVTGGDTINLNFQGWRRRVGGVPTSVATPANGSITYVDRQDQIWALNANIFSSNAGDTQSVVGFELGVSMARDDSAVPLSASEGAGSRAYDAIALGSAGRPTFAYTARGRFPWGYAASGMMAGPDGHGAGFVYHSYHQFTAGSTVEAAFLDYLGNGAYGFKKIAASGTDGLLGGYVGAEGFARHATDVNGKHYWGTGGVAADVTLQRESDGGMRWGGLGVRFDNWINVDRLGTGARLYFGDASQVSLGWAGGATLKAYGDLQATASISAYPGGANGVALGWDGVAAVAAPAVSFGANDTSLLRTAAGTLKVAGTGAGTGTLNAVAGFQVNGTALAALHLSNGVTGTGNVVLAASPTLTGTLAAAAITASGAITGSATINANNASANQVAIGWNYAAGAQGPAVSFGNPLDTIVYRTVTNSVTRLTTENSLFAKGPVITSRTTAPADADLATGELALWFDKTTGAAKLMVKAKDNGGTVRTGSLALA